MLIDTRENILLASSGRSKSLISIRITQREIKISGEDITYYSPADDNPEKLRKLISPRDRATFCEPAWRLRTTFGSSLSFFAMKSVLYLYTNNTIVSWWADGGRLLRWLLLLSVRLSPHLSTRCRPGSLKNLHFCRRSLLCKKNEKGAKNTYTWEPVGGFWCEGMWSFYDFEGYSLKVFDCIPEVSSFK